jgi:hypothetical protein
MASKKSPKKKAAPRKRVISPKKEKAICTCNRCYEKVSLWYRQTANHPGSEGSCVKCKHSYLCYLKPHHAVEGPNRELVIPDIDRHPCRIQILNPSGAHIPRYVPCTCPCTTLRMHTEYRLQGRKVVRILENGTVERV